MYYVLIVFVNGVPFFIPFLETYISDLREHARSRSAREHARGLSRVIDVYNNRGLNIVQVDCDNEHVRAVIAPRALDVVGERKM